MVLVKNGRRGFLRHLAGTGFAASSMRFLLGSAEAQTFPKRVLLVFTNAGRGSQSRSTGIGAGYTLGASYAALAPLQSKVLILDGLKIHPHTGEEHPCGKAALFTGRPAAKGNWRSSGMSFDRYLAGKLTSGASFFTGTYNGSGSGDAGGIANPVSWNGAGSANDAFVGTSTALISKLFGAGTMLPPTTPMQTPMPGGVPSPVSSKDQNEVALFDYLTAEVNSLKGIAPKLELERLELHVQALQQLRSRFAKAPAAGMNPANPVVTLPPAMVTRQCGASVALTGASTKTDEISLVIANAFACDRARIGVVRIGAEEPYHDTSHLTTTTGRDNLQRMDREWTASFANLLGYLNSFQEGSGTVLDNTLVLWGSDCCGEFGVGMDGGPKLPGEQDNANGIHNTAYMPFVLAGSLGGKIKTGQRVLATGRSSLDLYRTVAAQLGVDASDFGDAAFAKGPLTEITG